MTNIKYMKTIYLMVKKNILSIVIRFMNFSIKKDHNCDNL